MQAKTRSERETIVRVSDDPDEVMTVYTHRERIAKRLLRAGGTLKRDSRIDGEVVSWTVECPREWFREPKPKRAVSEAQREAARVRAAESGLGRRSKAIPKLPETEEAS